MLRPLLALLLGWTVWRLFRGLIAGRSTAPPPRAKGRAGSQRLDPERAVSASWSEVEEDKGS